MSKHGTLTKKFNFFVVKSTDEDQLRKERWAGEFGEFGEAQVRLPRTASTLSPEL